MVGEAIAGLSAVKTAFDLAKALKDMDTAAARNAAVIELQEKIFTAREAQTALLERVGELEKEVARLKDWEAEKQRYALMALAPGFFAYVLKPEEQRGMPPHAICANCYERSAKSILQSNGEIQWVKHEWVCPSCKTRLKCADSNLPDMIAKARVADIATA